MSKVNPLHGRMPRMVTCRETRTPQGRPHGAARPMRKREQDNEGTHQEKETRPGR
jgi:hypothetical protein